MRPFVLSAVLLAILPACASQPDYRGSAPPTVIMVPGGDERLMNDPDMHPFGGGYRSGRAMRQRSQPSPVCQPVRGPDGTLQSTCR
jgi:hypothetical protein